LPKDELEQLRKECRSRLIPRQAFHGGALKKDYNPSLLVKRSDRPFPLRMRLAGLGQRISAVHPAWIFAGQGPGILPAPLPPLAAAIMGPHAAAMGESFAAAQSAQISPEAAAPAATAEAGSEIAEAEEQKVPAQAAEEAPLKATVSLRLLGFDAAKKIAVVKEVRALLGEGLKESKELVESAPKVLRKAVPRAEAEAQAEKLRAAGAEVALE